MDEEPQRASLRGDRFLAHRGLIAVCCGTAVAEAGLLVLFAPAARGLAPQVTALPPLAIFHDLRWLYSTQRSWLWFALLLAGLVAARSALNTVLVRLAWPVHRTPPPLAALRSALVVTTLVCLLMSPLVSLTFGVAILPFSWPFLALLPAMLLIALPLSHAGTAGTWWRTLPPASAVWWLFAEFAVLTVAAAAAGALPAPDAIPVAGLAGLVNAWVWHGLTAAVARSAEPDPVTRELAGADPARPDPAGRELAGPEPARREPAGAEPAGREPAGAEPVGRVSAGPELSGLEPADRGPADRGPAGLELSGPMPAMVAAAMPSGPAELAAHRIPAGPMALAVVIAVVIALTRLIFVFSGPIPVGHPDPTAAWVAGTTGTGQQAHATVGAGHHPVLEIAGFGSWCCSQSLVLAKAVPGTVVQQFSYLGTNSHGQPLPYGPKAGNMPLPVLGDRIAAQVQRLHKRTGKPVDIVAESEGTLGVDAMLARHPYAPVGSVALLSPIVAPGQSGYRGGGGTGLVTGDELHALIWFVGGLSPFGTAGAQTLISSVNSVGARFAAAAAHHTPVRLLEVVPLADAVTLPACPLPPNVVVIPAFHGELLRDPAALQAVRQFLTGRTVTGVPNLRTTAEIVAAAATAWRMPESSAPSPPCGDPSGAPGSEPGKR
jgi:hypothetical protein